MEQRYTTAHLYLDFAQQSRGRTPLIAQQIRLMRMMAFTNETGNIDKATEQQLFQAIAQWEKELDIANETQKNDASSTPYHDLLLALADRYEKIGDIAKSSLFMSKTNRLIAPQKEFIWSAFPDYFFYVHEKADIADAKRLLELIHKSSKTPFEKWLTKNVYKDRYKFADLLGTLYLKDNQLQKALTTFNTIPASYWHSDTFAYDHYLDSNPFYVDWYNEHTPTKGDTIRYTKPEFVEKMIWLKQKAETAPKNRAYYYYLLGNGYYSITHYGNSWMMTRWWWSNSWGYYYNLGKYGDEANFYGCQRAAQYYKKAAHLSQDRGFAAFCYVMLKKCENNFKTYKYEMEDADYKNYKTYEIYEASLKENRYDQLLKTKFPEFYDTIYDCSTYDDFLASWTKS